MAPPVTLVIQSFGKEYEFRRAILTIWSYFAHTSLANNKTQVCLFTDNPEYFKEYFSGLPIIYRLLTHDKIKALRGEIDFLHRMKIGIIEEGFDIGGGDIIYADSDTFFICDPTPYINKLSENRAFMHEKEYDFAAFKSGKRKAYQSIIPFLSIIENQTFCLANGEERMYGLNAVSWNAGVMIFHSSHKRFLPGVYALTDQFYSCSKSHACEQYAFSFVLNENVQLEECREINYHYWYKVRKMIADEVLGKTFNSNWKSKTVNEKLIATRELCRTLPVIFDNHISMIRDVAIQSFHEENYSRAYKYVLKATIKNPWNKIFLKNVLYHIKRQLLRR